MGGNIQISLKKSFSLLHVSKYETLIINKKSLQSKVAKAKLMVNKHKNSIKHSQEQDKGGKFAF